MKETINITLKIDQKDLFKFKKHIEDNYELIDIKVLPNTESLYEEDIHFKKLVKAVRYSQLLRDEYINKNNFK